VSQRTEGEVGGKTEIESGRMEWNGSGDTLKLLTPNVNVCTNTGVSASLSGSRKTKLQHGQRMLTVTNTVNINQPNAVQHTSGLP
jgi:hypothetical protein